MAGVPLNPADAPSWYDFITKFDATWNSFQENYDALMQLGPYIQNNHPELLPQYEAMLQAGAVNADQLNGLKATRDYVYSWLQWLQSGASDVSSFVTSAAQNAYDYVKAQLGLGEMGFVPVAFAVIGVSAAIAALVVIAKWITDAYVFAQRLNALQAEEAKGATPAQAAATVNAVMGAPGATSNFLGIPWSLLIWGALAIALGPPLLRMFTGDRR
jgi:hypothetical protein